MSRRRANTTKYEIIQIGTRLFLEKGYSATTPKRICDELDISTGNLTYYFPTKEHLLAVLVKMLCDFQWKSVKDMVQEGKSSVRAICMELICMAAMCEENPIAKDLFTSAYASAMCLEIIRKNDTARAKTVFGTFCPDWSHEQFAQAEIIVSGIEYAVLMDTHDPVTLENRLGIALDQILKVFQVPGPLRKEEIDRALSVDYRRFSTMELDLFKEFVEQINEQMIEDLLSKN